jgi:hypothetical protein
MKTLLALTLLLGVASAGQAYAKANPAPSPCVTEWGDVDTKCSKPKTEAEKFRAQVIEAEKFRAQAVQEKHR